MPVSTYRDIFINQDEMFAQKITEKTTTWRLDELMKAAGIPFDAEITEHYYADDYGERDYMKLNTGILSRVEYFDEAGRPLKKVPKTRSIPVPATTREETYFEYELEKPNVQSFVPIAILGDASADLALQS